MRNRLTETGLWVAFGLLLALAWGSAARACNECAEEAITPISGTVAEEEPAEDGETVSSGKRWVSTGYYEGYYEEEEDSDPEEDPGEDEEPVRSPPPMLKSLWTI